MVGFFFSPRQDLSSHALIGGIFSLTEALIPAFPFPLPKYVCISLSVPLPFLSVSSHLWLAVLPSVSPPPSPCYGLLHTRSGSGWVRHLQHTQLSTGFVYLGWAMVSGWVFNLRSYWKAWSWTRGSERALLLQGPKAHQWSHGHPLMSVNLCICILQMKHDNSVHWIARHAPKLH